MRALAVLVASSMAAASSADASVRPQGIEIVSGALGARTTGTEVASGSRLFLESDAAGHQDSVHLYAGFANDPVNLRDPTGEAIMVPLLWLGFKLAVAGAAIGATYSAAEQGIRIAESDDLTASDFSWGAVGKTAAIAGGITPAAAALLWAAPGAAAYLVGLAGFGSGYAASDDIAAGNYVTAGFTLGTGALGSAGIARGAAASRAAFGFVDDAASAGIGAFAREATTVVGGRASTIFRAGSDHASLPVWRARRTSRGGS